MKAKIFSAILMLAVGFFCLSAKADTLVDTSSCTWNQYMTGNFVSVYSLICNGGSSLTKVYQGGCTLYPQTGYRVTGTCESFSLYRLDPVSSTSSSTSSSASSVCGVNHGALYATATSGSAIPGYLSGVAAFCGNCGYTVSRNYAGSDWWDIKCN